MTADALFSSPPAGGDVLLDRLLRDAARSRPDAIAVAFRGRRISYAELDRRSNQLAHLLRSLGVGAERPVAVFLERGIEAVLALLAILKAGGAYLPLDPDSPAARLSFILGEAAPAVVISGAGLRGRLDALGDAAATCRRLDLDAEAAAIAGQPTAAPASGTHAANLAYVIYTSGSTGEPKGAQIERGGLANVIAAQRQVFALRPDDRVLQFSSLSFDASVFELCLALGAGATLVVAPPEARLPGPALADFLEAQALSIVTLPPTVLAALPERPLPLLHTITVAGEACAADLVRRFAGGRRFFNLYGPTETTIWASYAECHPGPQAPPIGRPLPNTGMLLLDDALRPVADGAEGEICIAGIGVARGYLGRPQLTAERFVERAVDGAPPQRLYRSGDRGRRRADGSIEFIGRLDDQIKLRGFRVEPGEIEAALRAHPGVRDGVVALRPVNGQPQLVAYLVRDTADPPTAGRAAAGAWVGELRRHLGERLPAHMLPALFVALPALPLTLHGKVDRRALPDPELDRGAISAAYVAPRSPLEGDLTEVWQEVLNFRPIGVDDNFFELGGDSLLGAQLINMLQRRLGIVLYIVALFDAPTVAEQAAYLRKHFPDAVAGRTGEAAETDGAVLTEADAARFRAAAAAWHGDPPAPLGRRCAPAAFILSPPRSGSSLLRILLAGHSRLFAPPELELLSFARMGQRRARLDGRLGFMREGLLRALMEIHACTAAEAERWVAGFEAADGSTLAFCAELQAWLGDRLLVDKSTTYALSPGILAGIEDAFEDAVYVHLVRHPYGTIRSFEEARLDRVLTFAGTEDYTVRQFAELTWAISHRNILDFLATIPERRRLLVRFEDLLADPERVLRGLCERLGVGFEARMLDPYADQARRMTDGLSARTGGMSDPKFHAHRRIDPEVAEQWRAAYRHGFLAAASRRLAEALGYAGDLDPSPAAAVGEPLQSYAQQRLWFIDQMDPGNPAYNTSRVMRLDGRLDVAALRRSLNEILRRHAVCRSNFAIRDGRPVQVVHAARDWPLREVDLRGMAVPERDAAVDRLLQAEVLAPFDLARDTLCRGLLLRLGEETQILALCIHHIVSDAWSRSVLHRELSALYAAYRLGGGSPLAAPAKQYADFAAEQRRRMEGPEGQRLEAYWLSEMQDAPERLELPTDRPRPPRPGRTGGSHAVDLPAAAVDRLRAIGQAEGATPFMTFLLTYALLLGRRSGQRDLVIGIPVSGRSRPEYEDLIGQFINVLPIRIRWTAGESFRTILARLRETCVAAMAHQEFPFDLLVARLKLDRAVDRHPLFQVMFAWEQPPLRDLDLAGLACTPVGLPTKPMPYDLILSLQEAAGGRRAVFDYNLDLFAADSVAALAADYVALVRAVAEAPERALDGPLTIPMGEETTMSSTPGDGSHDAAEEARRKRERLKQLLLGGGSGRSARPITAQPPGTPLPLSCSQEELWLLDRIEPGSFAFNIGVPPLRLDGRLDPAALERALQGIVRRHAILRTVFAEHDGRPVQVVSSVAELRLAHRDLSELPQGERAQALDRLVDEEHRRPFDLARGPLLRATLVRLGDESHALVLVVHHIIFDASSVGRLFFELAALYGAETGGGPAGLPELPVQFADYAAWQRQAEGCAEQRRQLGYWLERLRGLTELRLPTDHPRRASPGYGACSASQILPAPLSDALRALGRRENVTLFHTTLAALMVLLHRYCGEDDIVVGSPVTTRRGRELEPLIGFFVNMLVLRSDLSGQPTFRETLLRVRDAALGALQNSEVPFDVLFRQLRAQHGASRAGLFQATFAFEGTQTRPLAFPGLDAAVLAHESKVTRFDIELYVRDEAEGMRLVLIGATDLFEPATVQRMLGHYRTLLEGIAADPARPIDDYPLITAGERQTLLSTWNDTARDFPRDACVHTLFAAQARARPQALAVQYGAESLTYAELDDRSGRLAAHLRRLGAGPGSLVGLAMERGAAQIVAMLGILKSGAAYVPLDPEYPAERLAFMLEDTGATIVVSQGRIADTLPTGAARLVAIDRDWAEIAAAAAPEEAAAGPEDLAYVIYTSGSTGTPKGVPVPHRAIVRLVCNTDYVAVRPEDRFAQVSVTSFDAATFEIWGALLNGAAVIGVAREVALSPREFAGFLAAQRISHLFLTTALFNQMARLAPGGFAPVDYVLFGGEAVDPEAVRGVLRDGAPRHLLHVYGPTEVTTFATWQPVTEVPVGAETVPIGRPIANTTAYVLDARQQPVPVGIPGELHLGGDGLARGYLNRPDLTERSFVPHPFPSRPGERLYRTGDWVRWRPDGAIEFIGRRDGQVKVRGFRIELGEIEAALLRLPAVQDAVVVVRDDTPGDRRVVAYVVAADGDPRSVADLRPALRAGLPEYMLPAVIVPLPRLPLNANGKVDRAALPAPAAEVAETPAEPPSGALEDAIARVWCEMLGVAQVGANDNFFDLGGHSLLLVKTHARLTEVLGCQDRLKVVDLFEHPTVASLARHLGGTTAVETPVPAAGSPPARSGAIAIIGMAGRFPDAPDIDAFWENLCAGRESVRFFDAAEMRAAGVPDEVIDDPDYVGARGYLDDADCFDAAYFGYSAREAEVMDPQHRLLLECAQATLESGGYDADRYAGAIGVFAGASGNTYLARLGGGAHLPASMGGLTRVLASSPDFLTTRVSYKLNLRGPSVNLQTACSTSLVAVHTACRALLAGECDMALAGGVSVTVPLKGGHMYVEEGIGSRDGHCRAFDAEASGTVGGNGVALVLLKPLEAALADGDSVHAVIVGTGVNNDGSAKVGFTAPSVEGQSRAVGAALAAAGCGADDIGYLEAHGTGTLLGDPIEVAALARVYGGGRRTAPLPMGSLKTNVGHLDAAAGVAGLIKAVLCVEHAQLVPSLNYQRPNPQIDFPASGLEVNTSLRDWRPADGRPRRAGVSSFGLGGTNAHLVIEQAPERPSTPAAAGWQVLCLAAKSAAALEAGAARLADHLDAHPEINLADVAYTLQVGRRELAHRRIVVCETTEDARAALRGAAAERVAGGHRPDGEAGEVVFLFSGQGTQYPDMGRDLYAHQPVFRDVVDAAAEHLLPSLGLDLRSVLYPDAAQSEAAGERLRETQLTQPALFVIEYAMARLWQSWGIRPAAMIGHSLGEYVAACVAGVMSFEDALDLVAERGRLMGSLPGGAMLAVPLPEVEVESLLGEELSLAAVNGPALCVVSGPEMAIAALEARLVERDLGPRRLHTSHAFHSRMVEPILDAFAERVGRLHLSPPAIPYVSNVTGDWITAEAATEPRYYARHLRQTVRFGSGLGRLLEVAGRAFLELGPGQTLCTLARRHPAAGRDQAFIASLRQARDARPDGAVLAEAVGRLWLAGVRPDWAAIQAAERRRLPLPTYAFERSRYWLEAASTPHARRQPDPQRWTWVPAWRRQPAGRPQAARQGAHWLLFCDGTGIGDALATQLERRGARVTRVLPGSSLVREAEGRLRIDPAASDDYRRLLGQLRDAGALPEYVVHFWALDGQAAGGTGFSSLLSLLQAIGAELADRPCGLAVVAGPGQDVSGDEALDPGQALPLGLCLNAHLEFPGLHARFVDVVPGDAKRRLAAELAGDLCAAWSEPVVAYRGGHRWVLDYAPLDLPPAASPPALLRRGGTYLITGGLGGVGLELAGYLARQAGTRLALIGRSPLPPPEEWDAWLASHPADDAGSRRILRLRDLQAAGATLLTLSADVADADQLATAFAAAEARLGRIDGVFHAAGAEKLGTPLASLSAADCARQFRPRLDGLRALAEVLRERSPDFCLVNSSLASALGVTGFAAYTAAHLFMDSFAAAQDRLGGCRWLTVNWDNWNLAGESASGQTLTEFYMRPEEALGILGRLLDGGAPARVLVSSGDLRQRVAQWSAAESADAVAAPGEAAAPAAGHARPELSTPYAPPQTEAERRLAAIWQEMLGIGQVGIHDNFFELGGDSVLNIQITARANQSGLRLTPRQVFERQTIAELAAVAGSGGDLAAEAEAEGGSVPLTPIQRWFFERRTARPEHFNLPLLVQTRRALDPRLLAEAIARLEAHHDALRLRYVDTPDGWQQHLLAAGGAPIVERFDLSGLAPELLAARIEAEGARLQGSLKLDQGPLLRAALFDCGGGQPGRLLLVAHHLIMDMVGWRIFLEDLQTAYQAIEAGREPDLPPRTTSFRRWAERLGAYAASPAAEAELAYWSALARHPWAALPRDLDDGPNDVASAERVLLELSGEETRALLIDLPQACQARIQDALLLALADAVGGWSGSPVLWVDVEGHGRDPIADDVDVSRTIGWFTSIAPLALAIPEKGGGAAGRLAAIAASLRGMPGGGMGFGVLRHLSPRREVVDALTALPTPELSFLYMGQFDQAFPAESLFAPAAEGAGPAYAAEGERHHLLEINSVVSRGRLRLSWTFSRHRHRPETIRGLAEACLGSLRAIIGELGAAAAAPVGSAEVSAADLAEIARQMGFATEDQR